MKPLILMSIVEFEDEVSSRLDDWLNTFHHHTNPKLTRTPTEDDAWDLGVNIEDIGVMYTPKAMELYNRACRRYEDLGKKLFPLERDLRIEAAGMIMP